MVCFSLSFQTCTYYLPVAADSEQESVEVEMQAHAADNEDDEDVNGDRFERRSRNLHDTEERTGSQEDIDDNDRRQSGGNESDHEKEIEYEEEKSEDDEKELEDNEKEPEDDQRFDLDQGNNNLKKLQRR